MPRLRRRYRNLAIVILAGCLGRYDNEYSPAQDDMALAAIASAWAGGGMTLSLCEDVAAPDSDNTCQVEHVVRGGGRGSAHEETHGGGGCGGCPFGNAAYVKGTASGGGLTGTVNVAGEIRLGTSIEHEPYAYPYAIQLHCTDPGQSCTLDGTVYEDGSVELERRDGGTGIAMLARTGPAACP
jgi:hypothetical protein